AHRTKARWIMETSYGSGPLDGPARAVVLSLPCETHSPAPRGASSSSSGPGRSEDFRARVRQVFARSPSFPGVSDLGVLFSVRRRMPITLALPKGRMFSSLVTLLAQSGLVIREYERSYRPKSQDPRIELKILKPQNIPALVDLGRHDLGF